MGLFSKETECCVCGTQTKDYKKLKDGSVICTSCANQFSKVFSVKWSALTSVTCQAFKNWPKKEDGFQADFTFDRFEADSEKGLFCISETCEVFHLSEIKDYRVIYEYRCSNSGDSLLLDSSRLEIYLNNPTVGCVWVEVDRDKDSLLEVFDVMDIKAKKSYIEHNQPIWDYIQNKTGKKLGKAKKERSLL